MLLVLFLLRHSSDMITLTEHNFHRTMWIRLFTKTLIPAGPPVWRQQQLHQFSKTQWQTSQEVRRANAILDVLREPLHLLPPFLLSGTTFLLVLPMLMVRGHCSVHLLLFFNECSLNAYCAILPSLFLFYLNCNQNFETFPSLVASSVMDRIITLSKIR